MMWLVYLLVFAAGYLAWWVKTYDDENPLDQLPGPRRLPVIGCALEFIAMTPRSLFLKVREFGKIYGDRYVVKVFKRRILHLHNVKDLEVVLSHSRNIKKSKPYTFLESWLGTGLLLSSGSKWHNRRKILTPTFHFNILKNFSLMIEERSRSFVEKLKEHDRQEVDLMPLISDFTLYTICETAMGTQLDKDQSSAAIAYKAGIMDIGSLLTARTTRFWLHNDFIFRQFPIGKKFQKCLRTVHTFADNVIEERRRTWKAESGEFAAAIEGIGTKRRLAMLDLLLEAESKGEIDLEGIREEVNTFMFEGYDTTAMAIILCLMLLADHEEIQERVHEECRSIFGESDHASGLSDLADMKYLEAVIKETLRLYPSVPFIAREITEDFMLDDLLVKKGAEVGLHLYDLHRRADLYPEPERFNPERFLGGEPMHPYAFIPFSAGPRNCIGQRFAMMEMKYVLSGICRNFALRTRTPGERPTLLADMLIRCADHIHVTFIRR